jgi:endonuclease/exonuclease/phosphatase family metal-dependent hydrolase
MKISILQWNIWCDEDVRNSLEFLKQNKADIICLQEMTLNYPNQTIKNSPEYIARGLGYIFHYQELPIESINGGKLMLANGIFSRFSISKKKIYWTNNPSEAGGYSNEKRVYVEVELNIGGANLTVGTTHMSYTHKFEINKQKQLETDNLLKIISRHKSKFVISGDMNAPPGSYTIKKLGSMFKNIGPDYDKNTWTTKPFNYNGFSEKNLNWRLDHIFATKDINLVKTKILKTNYSDHLPILTIVETF